MFAYEYLFSDLVESLEFALVDFKTRCPREYYITFDSILLLSGVECSDIGDRRRCSRAMQVLRRKSLCRYSRRHREWMVLLAV